MDGPIVSATPADAYPTYEAERAAAAGHDHGNDCANCGARLTGPYCHVCGQQGHVHRTAGAFVHDLLHGVFHFEGRFWATLPLLIRRPGELTRRYALGERTKFVSPMAMFLFSVFLLFAVVANLPGWHFGGNAFVPDLSESIRQTRIKLADDRAGAQRSIQSQERRLARLQAERSTGGSAVAISDLKRQLAELQETASRIAAAQRYLPSGKMVISHDAGPAWVSAKLEHAKANPQLLFYKLKSSAYKYSWALIPLSLPFIWLLFPYRRDVGLYEHAVFATYSLSFMSLLVVVLSVLSTAGLPAWVLSIAWLIPPLHMFSQLKDAYRLTRRAALWRTVCMSIFAGIASTLFVILLAYIGTMD
jgi:hypothetical protein